MEEIRLQKFLSEAGVASRRKAEEMIAQGRVSVNGVKVTEMGVKVTAEDLVEVDGVAVKREKEMVYIMLNKPCGYVTTVKDQFDRKTVLDLLTGVNKRVYPVGRLDYDTSGILLLTNDGDFTYKVTHPSYEKEKTYIVKVKGLVKSEDTEPLRHGVKIEDYVTSPAKVKILWADNKYSVLEIIIHEGRNRQVRKMCEAIGHPVQELKRVAIGKLKLGNLPEGKWRYLNENEVKLVME